ncbi:MAG: hypothetical protein BalsKO_11660 [Balneolaceae bacterium]
MITSRVQKINSPWLIVILSTVVSVGLYFSVSYLFLDGVETIGIFFSTLIPAAISYPLSHAKIEQLKKMEQQKKELEELNKINQRLFSTIAHDIRSPISSASMLLDLTLSGTLSVDESKKQLKEVSSSINVLMTFLDDLLLWSKLQIEKEPLKAEEFCSEEILLQTIQLYRNVILQKGIELKLGNLKSSIYMDKGSYSFAVRNLIQNAIKYTPKKGSINISVAENETSIITSVKDSGVGIDKEKVQSILEKQTYSSSKGTNQESGTGFGLKTTIDYIESQNGHVEIESEIDKGTLVSITMPKKKLV